VREQVNRTRSAEEMVERLREYLEELSRAGLAEDSPAPDAAGEPEAEGLVATG